MAGRTRRYRRKDIEHIERLVDVRSGRRREFRSADLRLLLEETARALGYRLLDYRLELFGAAHCKGPSNDNGEQTPRGPRRRERPLHRGGKRPARPPIPF